MVPLFSVLAIISEDVQITVLFNSLRWLAEIFGFTLSLYFPSAMKPHKQRGTCVCVCALSRSGWGGSPFVFRLIGVWSRDAVTLSTLTPFWGFKAPHLPPPSLPHFSLITKLNLSKCHTDHTPLSAPPPHTHTLTAHSLWDLTHRHIHRFRMRME